MIKRIIDISDSAYIHIEKRQLLIDKNGEVAGSIPIEDLGILVLQHPAIVVSQAAIIACQENNVAVVFCDSRHLPLSILLPISSGHSLHSKVLQQQVAVTTATKKRLWQQIVRLKITNQAETLLMAGKRATRLQHLIREVKSGDPENCEAQAARFYWHLLMGNDFRRDHNAGGTNALLNYGYSVMRAMIARAIVGSGLHPAFGLHHHNQYDGLCLADDLVEPFRPWVDWEIYKIIEANGAIAINRDTKEMLLGLLVRSVKWRDQPMPLMVACHYLTSDLKRVYSKDLTKLEYPSLCGMPV